MINGPKLYKSTVNFGLIPYANRYKTTFKIIREERRDPAKYSEKCKKRVSKATKCSNAKKKSSYMTVSTAYSETQVK